MEIRSFNPTSRAVNTAFFTAEASPVTAAGRRHIFDDLYRGRFQRKVSHHKPDGGRRAAEKSERSSNRRVKCHVKRLARIGGISKFQMSGFADVKFSGIFFCEFQ